MRSRRTFPKVSDMTALSLPLGDLNRLNARGHQTSAGLSSFQALFTDELTLGRRKLTTAFGTLPPRALKPAEFVTAASDNRAIFRLRAGWAYHYRDVPNAKSVILDVYIPGDVIGLDTLFRRQQPLPRVSTLTSATVTLTSGTVTLTSATVEVIPAECGLIDIMVERSTALYIFWLLDQRQRRAERHLAANTRFEPMARLGMMILDFYWRLRRRKLITGSAYNLPLTQPQIADYLGLSAVHVNRVLRSLREEHVVDLNRNCVTILDIKRLMALAGETNLSPAVEPSIPISRGLTAPSDENFTNSV
jgi:CRP/FNR family transcriptional regulator, anaerobic regulatory protein